MLKIIIKSRLEVVVLALLGLFSFAISAQSEITYTIAEQPWGEGFGNHRAIIEVSKSANAVRLDFNWRRHDANPEKRRFLIINAKTGDTIQNIRRQIVSKEKCELIFGPVDDTGLYYFYYLPFKPDKEHGSYRYGYLGKEKNPEANWVNINKLNKPKNIHKLPVAICKEIQARKPFDSFYPMEVTATTKELENFLLKNNDDYIPFPENREFPIKMRDKLPLRWIKKEHINKFEGKTQRNEYYAFQIGIYAAKKSLENVRLDFYDLTASNGEKLSSHAFTCFNTDGVDPYGRSFTKQVNVQRGEVQALWIGTDIPKNITPGTYSGILSIRINGQPDKAIKIKLNIEDNLIADRGDNEPWRHSRLRWLNSTIGLDDEPVAPYTPISFGSINTLKLYGKTIGFQENGLPSSIRAGENEILSRPVNYIIEGESVKYIYSAFTERNSGKVSGSTIWESKNFEIKVNGSVESDGYLHYKIKLKAKSAVNLEDFKIEIPFRSIIAEYMMGMGFPGTKVPTSHKAHWKGPHDSFWVGNTLGGLHVELRGSDYHGPLLNLFQPNPPQSWNNNGKGGFSIQKTTKETIATIYSGQREFIKGEEIVFEFSFLITPVKPINTHDQFTNRYYHNGQNPMPKEVEITDGVKIINVHHANKYNPYINYPFIATKEMRSFVDQMHAKDLKVKIYYTIRELTNRVTEIWAIRSLGNEILATGKGGGYPWLQEHFVTDYTPQWYAPMKDDIDASILTSAGDSRWYNYYLEGLSWLVKNMDIDGLYLDDVSYDRRILKRMRKILDRAKPGCLIDLHSNTGFSKGPATQYAEYFPYINKLWFGESFKYDKMPPENWLVEVSGIPFGLMGDMLHAGGNPWRGMVYGMTVRYPWFTEGVSCDPRDIWKVWDSFGIADAKMIGYWDKNPVVSTSNKDVKATAYVKEGKLLISVASWAKETVRIKLNIDWNAVGLNKSKVKIYAPKIEKFQPEKKFSIEEEITIDPIKGWLLIIE